jgi:predicted RNA-binding Zn-ribbon protein involved in translation (DUF1610 family)
MAIRCKVCGKRIKPTKEKIYIAKEPFSMSSFISNGIRQFQVTDCPNCGVQNILRAYLPKAEETEHNESEENHKAGYLYAAWNANELSKLLSIGENKESETTQEGENEQIGRNDDI